MDRLQRDQDRRGVLQLSWDIYEAAVEDGLIGRGGIDRLAGPQGSPMRSEHREAQN